MSPTMRFAFRRKGISAGEFYDCHKVMVENGAINIYRRNEITEINADDLEKYIVSACDAKPKNRGI